MVVPLPPRRRRPLFGLAAVAWIRAWLLAAAAVVVADASLGAKTFDVDKNVREWFRILHVDESYMLVGGANALYNVSLEHMTSNASIVVKTDDRGAHICSTFLQHFYGPRKEGCINYIRTALKVEDGKFVLCGSNSGTARCYRYEYDGQTNGWLLTSTQQDYNSPPFAPPFPWMNFTITKTSDNVVYTGGSLIDFSRRMSHVVFRNGSADGQLEPLLSSRVTETTVHSFRTYVDGVPVDARIYPNFVGSFEAGEHVYWLFSEPALELQPFMFVLTSRVARVCKNDMSNEYVNGEEHTWRLSTFSTFWKARLDCSVPGKHSGFPPYEYDQLGYNSFYFNVIGGATPLGQGSIYPRPHGRPPTSIMYGVFNTDRNSIRGSAICAYDREALAAPFGGSLYLLDSHDPHMASPKESRWTWSVHSFEGPANRNRVHPAKCTNDSRQRDPRDVYPRQGMLTDQAKPISNRPLFIQTDHSYQMTHILVDWQVRALDGRYYDVLFVGTDHGTILKVVNVGGSDSDLAYTIIENRTVTDGQAIGEMRLIDRGGRKVVLVNTFESVTQLALELCLHSATCSECVALRDPYCSWDSEQRLCVASYDGSQSANVQNIRRGVDSRCILPPQVPDDADRKPTAAVAGTAVATSATSAAPTLAADKELGGKERASSGGVPLLPGDGPLPAEATSQEIGSAEPEARRGTVERAATQSCPLCIYLVPAGVAVAALGTGFLLGWLSRAYCCSARPLSKRATGRRDSTLQLADQCLLKANNAHKQSGGLQLSPQSSKVYV